jgi:hypothetical protein
MQKIQRKLNTDISRSEFTVGAAGSAMRGTLRLRITATTAPPTTATALVSAW